MPYRTYSVSYQRERGFVLHLEEHSVFRDIVADILDMVLCHPFNHRFAWQYRLCNALRQWAFNAEKEVLQIPITREQAEAIDGEGVWDFLDWIPSA